MERIDGVRTDNKVLLRLIRKAEGSYTVSDLSKAIGPMIDLMFVSQFIGVRGVTVMGYVSPLIMLFELIGTTLNSGARNKASAMIGAGRTEEANRAFSGSLIVGGGFSMLAAILTAVLCPGVCRVLGAGDPEFFEMTKQYVFGYLIGLPFFTVTRILTPYLQMEGEYKRVNATAVLTTVIDVAADAFVVFVLHGGMFEIGLATSLGYVVPFFVSASYFWRRKHRSTFRLSFRNFDGRLCMEMIRLGAPSGMVKGSNALGGVLINNMLTAFNTHYLVAAYGVFSQITVFVRSSWYAPADTLHAFAGVLIGEEDRRSLKELQKAALQHAALYTGVVAALLFAFAEPLARILMKSDDPEALRMSAECIRVACLSLPFHSVVYNFNNYLMPVKRVGFSCLYSFLIECGCIVPVTFLMLRLMGTGGAWTAKIISMAILSLIAVLYVYGNKEGGTFRDKMLLLPGNFGVDPADEIAVAASSTEEILMLSKIAVSFALEHGAERKRAKTFGLVTEELAGIFSAHGFADGEKHHVNARLVSKDGDLIIRMRDDCKSFNLVEYDRIANRDRKDGDGPGLAIIMNMSKQVQYMATFGANSLVVRI